MAAPPGYVAWSTRHSRFTAKRWASSSGAFTPRFRVTSYLLIRGLVFLGSLLSPSPPETGGTAAVPRGNHEGRNPAYRALPKSVRQRDPAQSGVGFAHGNSRQTPDGPPPTTGPDTAEAEGPNRSPLVGHQAGSRAVPTLPSARRGRTKWSFPSSVSSRTPETSLRLRHRPDGHAFRSSRRLSGPSTQRPRPRGPKTGRVPTRGWSGELRGRSCSPWCRPCRVGHTRPVGPYRVAGAEA